MSAFSPGQLVRCIDDRFDAPAAHRANNLPCWGAVYAVVQMALGRNPQTEHLDLAVALDGFDETCFRSDRFEVIAGVRLAPPARPPLTMGASNHYPCLVVRICGGVYQHEPIAVMSGPPHVHIGHRQSTVQHPRPTEKDGNLTPECRELLVEGVKFAVQRTGFRMCVVWDADRCSYVEKEGNVTESNEPPSSGIKVFPCPAL